MSYTKRQINLVESVPCSFRQQAELAPLAAELTVSKVTVRSGRP
jgi:hypothetical protein